MASFGTALVLSITPLIVPIGPKLAPNENVVVIGSVVPSFAILAWSVFLVTLVIYGLVRDADRDHVVDEELGSTHVSPEIR